MNIRLVPSLLLASALLSMTGSAAASPRYAALGTSFTYQGRLTDGGSPANGVYDLQFKLYDAVSAGTQVGSPIAKDDVTLSDGLFTVQLDFGDVFDGTALYLDIGVRPGSGTGSDPYTALTPRQPLTATPYSLYAAKAPWSGLTGVPAGFADGVDNAGSFQNVVIVAQNGGNFTSIQAALDSISDASAGNPYLVWVAPGVYSEQVTMKPWVDIEGAGELTTKITYSGAASLTSATLIGSANSELRFLTVENTGGNDFATAIRNTGARLTHVSAAASGGVENRGVFNDASSAPMTDVTATASGGSYSRAVYNSAGAPEMNKVTASASGASIESDGVYNEGSSPTMMNMTARASGGTKSVGVYNNNGSSPTMMNVTAGATGASTANTGLYVNASAPTLINITATASGLSSNTAVEVDDSTITIQGSVLRATGGSSNVGLATLSASAPRTLNVNNSSIAASDHTIDNTPADYTIRVGSSQLDGGPSSAGAGTLQCVFLYDENYSYYASSCP